MATLTVIHQGHVQGSYQFADGTVTIGSDPGNDIVIAAPGVAPLHAAIQFGPGTSMLRQGDGAFPVTLNGQTAREHSLKDGDRIGIADHMLFYVDETGSASGAPGSPAETGGQHTGEAYLQCLSGDNIGRVLPLRNALTQLGKPGQEGAVVIAKRHEGYFLTALDHIDAVKINRAPVDDSSVQLSHGDLIDIGKQKLQFFWES